MYNQLELQTLGSQPVVPKNLLDHCLHVLTRSHGCCRGRQAVAAEAALCNLISYIVARQLSVSV